MEKPKHIAQEKWLTAKLSTYWFSNHGWVLTGESSFDDYWIQIQMPGYACLWLKRSDIAEMIEW